MCSKQGLLAWKFTFISETSKNINLNYLVIPLPHGGEVTSEEWDDENGDKREWDEVE